MNAAESLLRDHWGHGYLSVAVSASGADEGPRPRPALGVLTGAEIHAESEYLRRLINDWRGRD